MRQVKIHRLSFRHPGTILWDMTKANMKSRTESNVAELYALERTDLRTSFWQAAYRSLPEGVRERYLPYIRHAERCDLALDGVIEALSRAKGALARLLETPTRPRSAH
jgi:phosphoglycolate phosphatase-like HAD superfamily hydrolase